MLTREQFNQCVNDFFNSDELDHYDIDRWGEPCIRTHRYYCYLKKCVIDYRNGIKKPLNKLLTFLSNEENRKYLTTKLMDSPTQEAGEYWSSGNHEFLLRCLIVEVLKRSAGMITGIESHREAHCMLGSYDWLDIQFEIRSPTKLLFFRNESESIASGHVGAVKNRKGSGNKGFQAKGSHDFHEELMNAFHESTTIQGFIVRVKNIVNESLVLGKQILAADSKKNYVINGTETNDKFAINHFRRKKIKPYFAEFRDILFGARERARDFDELTDDSVSVISNISDESATQAEEDLLDREEQEESLYGVAQLFRQS